MNLLSTAVALVGKIADKAPHVLPLVTELLRAVLGSKDPQAAARRALKAAAAPAVAKKGADTLLRGKTALKRKIGK